MSILLVTQNMFVSDKINIIGNNILYFKFKFTLSVYFFYKNNLDLPILLYFFISIILLKTIILILSILILFMALV